MNAEAETIYRGMQAMAKGKAGSGTHNVTWCGLVCAFYPMSGRYNWFAPGHKDITRGLTKQQVISLINIELGGE